MVPKDLLLIGRKEKVAFPDFGIDDLDAKVDTGAYTTALHCNNIRMIQDGDKIVLTFNLSDSNRPDHPLHQQRFEHFIQKDIKNSFGDSEKRFIIKTRIKIGRKIIKTSISLTDRGGMRYPVLIGRKLLRKRFLVDVNQMYLLKGKK